MQMRYEVKMTCEEVYLAQVRSVIMLHPAGFSEAYPPRQVNNIYLDTPGLDCLNDHIDGAAERSKLRFRWYGPDYRAVHGVLELKHKAGRLGWKEYGPISATFDLTTSDWEAWIDTLRDRARGPAAHWLAWCDRPTLLNRYIREYYESADGAIRITLDYEQAAFEQLMWSRPNLHLLAPNPSCTVVEIKASAEQYKRVSDVASCLPLQVEHNSKYVGGMLDTMTFI
jgi:hypothetical protein